MWEKYSVLSIVNASRTNLISDYISRHEKPCKIFDTWQKLLKKYLLFNLLSDNFYHLKGYVTFPNIAFAKYINIAEKNAFNESGDIKQRLDGKKA